MHSNAGIGVFNDGGKNHMSVRNRLFGHL